MAAGKDDKEPQRRGRRIHTVMFGDEQLSGRPSGPSAAPGPHAWPPAEEADAPRRAPGLSLSGDLETMVLGDLLAWIATRRKTGMLHMYRGATHKRVVFQDGVLHSSSSNDPREALGQFLVRDRLVSEEQLFTALLRQEQQGTLLGLMLVSDGVITMDQLKKVLWEKAEASVYELFLWTDGTFFFQEGQLPKSVPLPLELDTSEVVREGTRRRRRWERLREKFPSGDVAFTVSPGAAPPGDPVEREVLELAAAGKTLHEISLATRRGEYDTSEILWRLLESGLLVVERVAGQPAGEDTVGAIQQLLEIANAALVEKRHDEAFEAFQDVLALDHLNQAAKKGLIAASEGRKYQRLQKRIALDLVPISRLGSLSLAKEKFTAEEGFLLSRINGSWDVRSIVKLMPMREEEVLEILARLLDRKVIELTGRGAGGRPVAPGTGR